MLDTPMQSVHLNHNKFSVNDILNSNLKPMLKIIYEHYEHYKIYNVFRFVHMYLEKTGHNINVK